MKSQPLTESELVRYKQQEAISTAKPVSRYRAAENWVDSKGLEDSKSVPLWTACDELRVLEQTIIEDSRSIALDALRFADNLEEFGASHSAPCSYRRYDELQANIKVFEAKIEALFSMVAIALGHEAKAELRSAMGVK